MLEMLLKYLCNIGDDFIFRFHVKQPNICYIRYLIYLGVRVIAKWDSSTSFQVRNTSALLYSNSKLRPKWSSTTIWQNIYVGISHCFRNIYIYIWMYHALETWVLWKNSLQVCHDIFLWNLSSSNLSYIKNWWLFFMKLNFVKLELHGKLGFHKLEF